MENQHKKIKGYRDLTQSEIDLMNRVKDHAEKTKQILDEVSLLRFNDIENGLLDHDQMIEAPRCLEKARTHLQEGQMWFVRAIALPNSF